MKCKNIGFKADIYSMFVVAVEKLNTSIYTSMSGLWFQTSSDGGRVSGTPVLLRVAPFAMNVPCEAAICKQVYLNSAVDGPKPV